MSTTSLKPCPQCKSPDVKLYPVDRVKTEYNISCATPATECEFYLGSTNPETLITIWNNIERS
jgi:hypothetical protein